MSKPIIIDGVDVAECFHRATNAVGKDYGTYCREFTGSCIGQKCYYKQLQRMKTECNNFKKKYRKERAKRIELEKRLNEQAEIFKQSEQEGSKIISELEQENARLKEEKDFWCKKSGEFEDFLDNITNKEDKYKQALQEIKEMAQARFVNGLNEEADCYNKDMERITNKTNEVLNDRT